MNPLNEYPEARKILYFVQWVYNGAAVILGAYFVAQQTPVDQLPGWYVKALAIAPALWAYLGLTAQANTSQGGDGEPADVDVDEEPHEVPDDPEPEPEELGDDIDVDPEDRVDLADDDHAGD